MKVKSILILILVFIAFSGYSQVIDLRWDKPLLESKRDLSWLQGTEENYITSEPENETEFALSSFRKLKNSFWNYFRINDNSQFYRYSKDDINFNVSLIAGADLDISDRRPLNFQYYGLKISGKVTDRIFFYSDMWAGHFNQRAGLIPNSSFLIDSWTKTPDDKTFLDNVRGKLLYRGEYIEAGFGRGKYEIGSNIGGSIILSDNCNDYGYFNIDLNLGDFTFSSLTASMVQDSATVISGNGFADFEYSMDKFLALHKVTWKKGNLNIFLGESVVYGARSPELSYILPVNIMRLAEHNLGDNDNVLMFAGLDYIWKDNIHIYGNMIIDEFRTSEIFSDWWGNKYALQAGNAFLINKKYFSRAVFEVTMVRPWLYTHYGMPTKYSHDKIGLGFPEGGNLLQGACEMNFPVNHNLDILVYGAFIRQGETGSSWNTNYNSQIEDIQTYETALFAGNPENRVKVEITASWQILAHHKVKMSIYSDDVEDKEDRGLYLSWMTEY